MKIGPSRSTNVFVRMSRMYVPVMSDGRRSGVNWMRRKWQPSVPRERLDERGLRDARDALEQDVAAREQRDEQRLGDRRRADERAADLVGDRARELVDAGELVGSEGGMLASV